jgi:hypothetical protein
LPFLCVRFSLLPPGPQPAVHPLQEAHQEPPRGRGAQAGAEPAEHEGRDRESPCWPRSRPAQILLPVCRARSVPTAALAASICSMSNYFYYAARI